MTFRETSPTPANHETQNKPQQHAESNWSNDMAKSLHDPGAHSSKNSNSIMGDNKTRKSDQA
jgi:hypothetical protein